MKKGFNHRVYFLKKPLAITTRTISILIFLTGGMAWAAPKVSTSSKKSKKQEVNFEEMSLQGQIRNPQGAYLVQKNGIRFMPLYEVQKNLDQKIRQSQSWMR